MSQLEEGDDDLERVVVGKNMHKYGQIVVGVVAALKALSWQGILATSPQVPLGSVTFLISVLLCCTIPSWRMPVCSAVSSCCVFSLLNAGLSKQV